MSRYKPKISCDFARFNADITTTNFYRMLPCPPPLGYFYWQRLELTSVQLPQWHGIETRWKPLYTLYCNKKTTRKTDVKDQLKLIIKESVALDRPDYLYDGIAININAIITGFETFRIIRGTSLAATSYAHTPALGTKGVVIVLKKMGILYHQLLVTSLNKKGRGKKDGVKEILVYKADTAHNDPSPALNLFQYVGEVSRGLIKVIHNDDEISQKAWYFARIKNSRGELGVPSAIVGYIVV